MKIIYIITLSLGISVVGVGAYSVQQQREIAQLREQVKVNPDPIVTPIASKSATLTPESSTSIIVTPTPHPTNNSRIAEIDNEISDLAKQALELVNSKEKLLQTYSDAGLPIDYSSINMIDIQINKIQSRIELLQVEKENL